MMTDAGFGQVEQHPLTCGICICYRAKLPLGDHEQAHDIVVAITGASGALYAQRFIHGLAAAGVHAPGRLPARPTVAAR